MENSTESTRTLPEGWCLGRLEEICYKVQSGSTPKGKPFTDKGDVPFLKVYNIVKQEIAFDYRPQFIPREVQESQLSRSIVLPDDILMNIVGPPLGKVAVVTNQFPEWNLNQALVLLRPRTILENQYLYYFLLGGDFVRDIMSETKGSVGQVNISLTQCRNCEIPLPPLNEQHASSTKSKP
ncbi:MAG: restriction endonuclease subunit S [Phormidesmis sp.]